MNTLPELQEKVDDAQNELHDALVRLYPPGTVVLVKVSPHNQIQPTRGTVINHGSNRDAGYVRLRLQTKRELVRDFLWKDIIRAVLMPSGTTTASYTGR